jgi:hypothetical protein
MIDVTAALRLTLASFACVIFLGCCQKCKNPVESPELQALWKDQLQRFLSNVGRAERIEIETEVGVEIPGFESTAVRVGPIVVTDPATIKMIQREIDRMATPKPIDALFRIPMSGPDARLLFICSHPYGRESMTLSGKTASLLKDERFDAMLPDTALRDAIWQLAKSHAESHPQDITMIEGH